MTRRLHSGRWLPLHMSRGLCGLGSTRAWSLGSPMAPASTCWSSLPRSRGPAPVRSRCSPASRWTRRRAAPSDGCRGCRSRRYVPGRRCPSWHLTSYTGPSSSRSPRTSRCSRRWPPASWSPIRTSLRFTIRPISVPRISGRATARSRAAHLPSPITPRSSPSTPARCARGRSRRTRPLERRADRRRPSARRRAAHAGRHVVAVLTGRRGWAAPVSRCRLPAQEPGVRAARRRGAPARARLEGPARVRRAAHAARFVV